MKCVMNKERMIEDRKEMKVVGIGRDEKMCNRSSVISILVPVTSL